MKAIAMNPTYDFAGQVSLATGASCGMGFATARAFAEQGACVTLADIKEDALRIATDELTATGHQALGVVCDVPVFRVSIAAASFCDRGAMHRSTRARPRSRNAACLTATGTPSADDSLVRAVERGVASESRRVVSVRDVVATRPLVPR